METRDQWYKPNLLYNIHYRPPQNPEPPKMIVETVRFNPSVCTCGEHGCEPRYRMEKRVLWTKKEFGAEKREQTCAEKREQTRNERGKKDQVKDINDETKVGIGDRNEDIKKVRVGREEIKTQESKIKDCNEEGRGESKPFCINFSDHEVARICENNKSTAGDGHKHSMDRIFKTCDREVKCDRISAVSEDDVKDASGYEDDSRIILKYGKNERGEVTGDICDGDVSRYKEKHKGSDEFDGTGSRNTDGTIIKEQESCEEYRVCDDVGNERNIETYKNNNRNEMSKSGSEADGENDGCNITKDEQDEISSAFGIMSVYCNSEIHSWERNEDDYK